MAVFSRDYLRLGNFSAPHLRIRHFSFHPLQRPNRGIKQKPPIQNHSTATCRYLESTLVVTRKPSHSRSIVATPNTATPSRCRPAVTLSPFLRSPPWLVPAHVQRRTSRLQKRQRDKAPAERSCKSG